MSEPKCPDCGEAHGEVFEFNHHDLQAAARDYKVAAVYVERLAKTEKQFVSRDEAVQLIEVLATAVKHLPKLIAAIEVLVGQHQQAKGEVLVGQHQQAKGEVH